MAQDDGLMREVDQALRDQRMQDFWTSYGKTIAVLIGLVVVLAAAFLYWKNEQNAQSSAYSDALWKANRLLDARDEASAKEAQELLAPVADSTHPLATLAALKLVEVAAVLQDPEVALPALEHVASRDSVLAQLACSQLVAQRPQEVPDCASNDGAMKPYIDEMVAAEALQAGEKDVTLPEASSVIQQNRLEPLQDYLASQRGDE